MEFERLSGPSCGFPLGRRIVESIPSSPEPSSSSTQSNRTVPTNAALKSPPQFRNPNESPPESSQLGEEIPRNIQCLLSRYFKAKHTTTVPLEIYCIQVHRVNGTVDGRAAVYQGCLRGEHVEVRGYTLPSMKLLKSSEKMLVAAGRMFSEPVVLARIKPYSNDFRIWRGAADDGTGQPVITRYIPKHGKKVDHKRKPSSAPKDRAKKRPAKSGANVKSVEDETQADVLETTHATPGASSTVNMGDQLEREDSEVSNAPTSSVLVRALKHSLVNGVADKVKPHPDASSSAASMTTLRRGQNNTLERPTPTITMEIAQSTTFHFVSAQTGMVSRKRTLRKVETVATLFTHAYAGDVITERPGGMPILEATVGELGETVKVVDGDDFEDLVEAIATNDCWAHGAGCEVYVSGIS
jgi:hypothetical protein